MRQPKVPLCALKIKELRNLAIENNIQVKEDGNYKLKCDLMYEIIKKQINDESNSGPELEREPEVVITRVKRIPRPKPEMVATTVKRIPRPKPKPKKSVGFNEESVIIGESDKLVNRLGYELNYGYLLQLDQVKSILSKMKNLGDPDVKEVHDHLIKLMDKIKDKYKKYKNGYLEFGGDKDNLGLPEEYNKPFDIEYNNGKYIFKIDDRPVNNDVSEWASKLIKYIVNKLKTSDGIVQKMLRKLDK